MLYNVYINHGVAVKVTEFNQYCVPCNESGAIQSDERRVMNVEVPTSFFKKIDCDKNDAVKRYINLNNLL